MTKLQSVLLVGFMAPNGFFAYGKLVRCWNPGVSQICRRLVAVEKGYLREIFAVAVGWEGLEDVLKVWLWKVRDNGFKKRH